MQRENEKKLAENLFIPKKLITFAPAFKTSKHWRDGRVVDYSSLENYRTERYRGFESLSLRQKLSNPKGCSFFCLVITPFMVVDE